MSETTAADGASGAWTLARFLRARKERILAVWLARLRTLPASEGLSEPELKDSVPRLLDRIAECIEEGPRDGAECLTEDDLAGLPDEHAIDRLAAGFDLKTVAREYRILRSEILHLWHTEVSTPLEAREVARFDDAIDQAVIGAVGRYVAARDRTLRALDSITAAALTSADLDAFMARLLDALRHTRYAVDSAAIYVRDEHDRLVVRAAVGAAQEHAIGKAVAVGECLAGRAALHQEAVVSRDARADPRITSDLIVKERLASATAIPLLLGDDAAGVVVITSDTATDVSEEDLVHFRALAIRAASLLALARSHEQEVAARGRAEEAQRRFMRIVESGIIGIVEWHASGAITFANDAVLDMLGYSRDELAAGALDFRKLTPAAHQRSTDEALRALAAQGFVAPFEKQYRRKDGALVDVLLASATLDDDRSRGIALIVDVTERKKNDGERQKLESRTRIVAEVSKALATAKLELHATVDGLCVEVAHHLGDVCTVRLLAPDGHTLLPAISRARDPAVDAVLQEFNGTERPYRAGDGVIGHVLERGERVLLSSVGPDDLAWMRAAVPPERRAGFDARPPRSIAFVPLRARHGVIGLLTAARYEPDARLFDAADADLLQEIAERAALAIDNARLYEASQEAARTREEIVGIVSHDLRNPLGAISMAATALLRRDDLDERATKAAARIASASDRATRMIRDLLDYTSARASGIPVEPREVDLGQVVEQVLAEMQEAHPGSALVVERAGDCRGTWDADRLSQVLTNLVGNALQHGAADAPVRVSVRGDEGDAVVLAVANDGPGIPADVLPRIFEPFRSGHAPRGGGKSLGLGLYIAARIVRAHRGTIEVASPPGGPTVFSVRLPR